MRFSLSRCLKTGSAEDSPAARAALARAYSSGRAFSHEKARSSPAGLEVISAGHFRPALVSAFERPSCRSESPPPRAAPE